jgi:hypothetical protein
VFPGREELPGCPFGWEIVGVRSLYLPRAYGLAEFAHISSHSLKKPDSGFLPYRQASTRMAKRTSGQMPKSLPGLNDPGLSRTLTQSGRAV